MSEYIEAILLDLDGTLIGGDEASDQALLQTAMIATGLIGVDTNDIFKQIGVCSREIFYAPPFDVLRTSTGAGAIESLASDFTGCHPALESLKPCSEDFLVGSWFNALFRLGYSGVDLARELSVTYRDIRSKLYEPNPEVLDLLSRLAREYKLAIVTNGLEDVQTRKIKLGGLDQHVPIHIISGRVGVAKPNRAMFDTALLELGIEAKNATMVGDSLVHDIRGAAEVGISTVWIANGRDNQTDIQPNHSIDNITMLEAVLY